MSTVSTDEIKTDTVVVGAGIAGIVAALTLLDRGGRVVLLDAGEPENFGGLAIRAFGGVWLAESPIQRMHRIKDDADVALQDWMRAAEFGAHDLWPRRWAEHYVARCIPDVYEWLKNYGVGFLPAVQWPEKGLFVPGNSVPRYHVLWGCAQYMTRRLIAALQAHPRCDHLEIRFRHRVVGLDCHDGRVSGCSGVSGADRRDFHVQAGHVVLACGGITGNLEMVRRHWPADWPEAPREIFNGCHPNNDGVLHTAVGRLGGQVTHLDKHWNYAAGVRHPRPHYENEGLSLIPCRSALWMDYQGRRIGPQPLMTGFDTRFLCEQVTRQERPYTWQVMNRKIALKELSVSGAEHNPAIRDRKWLSFVWSILTGDRWLYREMTENCEDFVVADTVSGLAGRMNELTGTTDVQAAVLEEELSRYDQRIAGGRAFHNDDQLRRIAQLRGWSGDRVRTCKFQKLLDPSAGPLVAIRLRLITRKTLGGMQTDLDSQVLDAMGNKITGLYAVGEAAGFGGGGITGLRSLEGHCLSGGILNAQAAARSIPAS